MSRIKPIPIPPETSAFKKGISMTEQLRKEKALVEKSALSGRETNSYHQFNIKIPIALADQIKNAASQKKLKHSRFIRNILELYMKDNNG